MGTTSVVSTVSETEEEGIDCEIWSYWQANACCSYLMLAHGWLNCPTSYSTCICQHQRNGMQGQQTSHGTDFNCSIVDPTVLKAQFSCRKSQRLHSFADGNVPPESSDSCGGLFFTVRFGFVSSGSKRLMLLCFRINSWMMPGFFQAELKKKN